MRHDGASDADTTTSLCLKTMQLYTVEEARGLLPRVIPVLERMRDAFLHLRALQAATAAEARGAMGDGHLVHSPLVTGGEDQGEKHRRALSEAATQLEEWGIEVKDPERGLIDFYHRRGGEVVLLCYMLGERGIEFWHTRSGGFAGRQPI